MKIIRNLWIFESCNTLKSYKKKFEEKKKIVKSRNSGFLAVKQRNVTSVDVGMGATKILILGFCLTLVSAQVLQDNDLQRILRSYLNDLKLNSNAIFAQKITEVTIFHYLMANFECKLIVNFRCQKWQIMRWHLNLSLPFAFVIQIRIKSMTVKSTKVIVKICTLG